MSNLTVDVIPYFDDNFAYFIQAGESGPTAVVDCGDSNPIIDFINSRNIKLDYVLATHSHYDHAGDISSLIAEFPDATVVKPKGENRIKEAAHEMADGDSIEFGPTSIKALSVPAHTSFCVSYLIDDSLFVGDALFSGGCGRLFEGSPENLEQAMDKLSKLPGKTKVYFGHEYTLSNLKFALSIEPTNEDLQAYFEKVTKLNQQGSFSTPSTIELERKINPFFRIDQASVVEAVDPNKAMTRTKRMELLRKRKDNF